jgi:hypothetical protein
VRSECLAKTNVLGASLKNDPSQTNRTKHQAPSTKHYERAQH